MVKLVSDSSCDMITMEGIAFQSVPLTISTDERSYVDDENIDAQDLMDYLRSYHGRSYTACPSIDLWLQAFEGYDEVYVACLTSGLSGTYNSAMNAREIYMQEHPGAKVHCFDTLTAGPQLKLLMEKVRDLKAEGHSFEETVELAEAYMKSTRLLFAFQSLHNFAQNGRVSKVVAAATGMLGIRIIGTADEAGTIEVLAKVRGDKKARISMMKELENMRFNGKRINVSHANNPAGAQAVIEALKEKYPDVVIDTYEARGICSYYGEEGAIFLGLEVEK